MSLSPPPHSTPPTPSLNLFGAGRLGQTLAHLWQAQSLVSPQQLLTRSITSAQAACDFIDAGQACDQVQQLKPAKLWLIATPDNQLTWAVEQLAQRQLLRPGDTVFHCSGAHSSELLQPLREQGAATASVHPVHSFASPASSVASFSGSHCACEGEATALHSIRPLFEAIGGRCFEIAPEHKSLYHAGSVMACNYLVSLLEASRETFALAGIDAARASALMAPLVQQTTANLLGSHSAQPQTATDVLTGPIARGDVNTVAMQLQQLQQAQGSNAGLTDIYRCLGRKTLTIARQQAQASIDALDRLEALLDCPLTGKSR